MIINQLKHYRGEAIVDKTGTYDFQDLLNQVEVYKSILVGFPALKQAVVVIDSDYSFYSISLLFALHDMGCIMVPIVKTTQDEFDLKVTASEANAIITINTKNKLDVNVISKEKIAYKDYQDIIGKGHSGIVLFSSGTTGVPKVMVHDFDILLQSFKPPRRQKGLRFLLFLMFDHIGGLNTLLNCLINGSPIIIPKNRNPEDILELIEKQRVQVLPTSPTFLNLLLQVEDFEKKDLSTLKLITYGTEKMPQVLLDKLNKAIPNIKLLQTFGTSETGILKTQSKSSNSLYFKIVDKDIDYKVEDNQLLIKSKTVVKGYKGVQSDKFTEDGWFITGDLVEFDDDGYMRITGRINDVINVGGLKVLPTEVEDVLNTIEGVIDSTVYSRPNAITGQVVCAKIIKKPNVDKIELKKRIKKICALRLDKYKNPVKLLFSDNIEYTTRFKKER
jgi:acyl-coenzyme A synthetase/AMP-(fatty) acid ligase